MLTVGCGVAGQLAGRKGAVVANTNLVKIAIHNGLKYYMLAPLPRGKGARKRAELGLSVRLMLSLPFCKVSTSSGLPSLEAPFMISEKRKLFFSFVSFLKSALSSEGIHSGQNPCLCKICQLLNPESWSFCMLARSHPSAKLHPAFRCHMRKSKCKHC